ncbi:DNA polymerase III subunit gamma and tau, partial [Kitasatospora sp. NPDC057512]|uniref:DNA polymerase III subunit gamma and tau n=1 Tax=Kitasatospora sp. NPDC057512 TaxID=3346154 RepID=UPI0036A8F796
MSLALYRRYRPETFAEVIGQEHVTAPLQQALRNNRVNHAYLFSGPRGCGKTTSARILARCLNCEQGPTPTPCGECQSCRDLATGGPGSIDVIEIDAASHGGVDDARELRERAFFAPVHSRYKIFILDEAHMVTSAGFNALLKVVEEPPEHLKFIFATTEPEKVIGTIRSRTHHYPFRLVPPGTLRDYLAEVCGREGIQVEDTVFPLVVRAGAGSVRDSMSVMDQLLAGAGEGGVTYQMATALLGYTDSALLDEVVDAFAAHDGATVFQVIDRVVEGGHDPRRFVTDLLERLRDLVILATVPDAGEKGLIDAPADRVAVMQAQADAFGAAELSRAADLVNTGLTEMRGNAAPRLQLELICARVMLPGAYSDELSLQARMDKLERRASAGGFAAPMAVPGGMPMAAPMATPPTAVAPVAEVPVAPAPVQPAAVPAAQAPQPVQAPPPAAAPAGPAPGAWPIPRSFPPAG